MAVAKQPKGPQKLKVEHERTHFRSLLLQNPNHFGNLQASTFQPVKKIVSNTTYEKLKCVGYQPQLSRLEAVVWIEQPVGYGGGICSSGSPEYLRFWLSYDNGVSWLDQGMESFTAYDIPGVHPLEYAVSLAISPDRLFCIYENLPLVRAILSWNVPPTDPNTPPVWGNIVDARIQIAPSFYFEISQFKSFKVEFPAEIEKLIDPAQPLKLKAPEALSAAQLKTAYAGKNVPAHRYLHGEIHKHLTYPELAVPKLPQAGNLFSDLDIDLSQVLTSFAGTNGNTNYEELTCVGLDPDNSTPDALMAAIHVKQPNGYLGSLCFQGSVEYVAFWVDWDNTGWEWAGTAQVRVHDISSIPPGGLSYAVYQPINLEPHRRPCEKGATIARVRAILSWNTPPPPNDPDYVPHWGGRLETHVHIYPGVRTLTGDYTPYLQNLCGIPVCNIDQTTGLVEPGENPFGGSVYIYGYIPGAPPVKTPEPDLPRYRISVRQLPFGAPQFLNDSFNLTVDEQINPAQPTSKLVPQQVDSDNYYIYREASPSIDGWRTVTPSRLLAVWNSAGKTGLWEIQIEALNPNGNIQFAASKVVCVGNGNSIQNVIIDLDQAAPVTSLQITGYIRNGVEKNDILDCGTFQVGDVILGEYGVSDEHFNSFSLTAEPIPGAGTSRFTVDALPTNSRSYPAVPTTGQFGTWAFDTAGLAPCGYTIQLNTNDRTIVSCNGGWQNNSAFVGFCLVKP